MKLDQLPDDFTTEQFMRLDKESLDAIPFTRRRWLCQCKRCTNGTTIRDYGLDGYFFLHRNSKAAARNPHDYWMGRGNYWLCGKHNRLFKRLDKRFDFDHIWRRLIDQTKTVIVDMRQRDALESVARIERKGIG